MALHSSDAFVFVGFSLNDMDFRKIYLDFVQQLKTRNANGKTTFFVSPAEDKYSYALGSEIWRLREAMWIPLGAKTFFAKLRDVVQNRAIAAIREQVGEKYRRKGKEVDALIDLTSKLWRLSREDALLFLYEARTRVGGN